MTLSMTAIMDALLFCLTLRCMVPLPSARRPPVIPFNVVLCCVVFCIGVGVGWFRKSWICGVMQQDAPESIIVCVMSSVEV
jgi:hypothetical protein